MDAISRRGVAGSKNADPLEEQLSPGKLGALSIRGPGHAWAEELPAGTTQVAVRVRVDGSSPTGLNFFALQVNFPNETWAHGGLQLHDGKPGTNWGGLRSRGGGKRDYLEADPAKDLELIQNPPNEQRSTQTPWKHGQEYLYTVERGEMVKLPPGQYKLGNAAANIDHERKMRQWTFSIRDVKSGKPIHQATLLNSSNAIASALVWNETGRGASSSGPKIEWSELAAAGPRKAPVAVGYAYVDGGAKLSKSLTGKSSRPKREPAGR